MFSSEDTRQIGVDLSQTPRRLSSIGTTKGSKSDHDLVDSNHRGWDGPKIRDQSFSRRRQSISIPFVVKEGISKLILPSCDCAM